MEMAFAFIELLPYRVTGKVCDRNHGEIGRLCGEFIERHPVLVSTFFIQRKLSQGGCQEEQAYRYLGRNC